MQASSMGHGQTVKGQTLLHLLISLCIICTVQQLQSLEILLASHAQLPQPEGYIALLPNLLRPRDLVQRRHAMPVGRFVEADQLNLKGYALIIRTSLQSTSHVLQASSSHLSHQHHLKRDKAWCRRGSEACKDRYTYGLPQVYLCGLHRRTLAQL